ncbi:hypothetical protein MN116_005868 [Schistosoma mekongi]|uniref:F-box only protein 8 n=1 Tax=Schistosoma mekongi TaxID=38744 RepID=A0AAE1Z9V2_SCHME|nr:hypothetical protein MN116_005868 [Schistosoma mekongi]
MGLVLALQHSFSNSKKTVISESSHRQSEFVDLHHLPAELALNVLSRLNATDLYLASCVWYDLAYDELLWRSLCKASWPFCSAYTNGVLHFELSFRQLYLKLDEARLTFNADAFEGMAYIFRHRLVDDNTDDLVNFFSYTSGLDPSQRRRYLETRPQVLRGLVNLKDFRNYSLPNALRGLFTELPAPLSGPSASAFTQLLVSMFSERFAQCNPDLGITRDEIYLLCFSMIMLSVDLWSPSIKNKMSKREFIRNTRQVVTTTSDEFLGNLYDNVYIVGHVVLIDCCGSPFRHLEAKAILSKSQPMPLLAF